jgi:hypothetical protein
MKKPPIGRLFGSWFWPKKNDRKIREVAKLEFSKPSVERLSERFLKKEGFSEKPGTTKSLNVEAALLELQDEGV